MATAAGFSIGDNVTGTLQAGNTVTIKWHAATGGAKATLTVSIKSKNPAVSDFSQTIVSNTTAGSANWAIPESILDRVNPNGVDIGDIVFKLTTTGASWNDSMGGPNFLQFQSISATWDYFSSRPKMNPTVSSVAFADQDPVASALNAYVIGKSKVKVSYTVNYKHYATPKSKDTDLVSSYNKTNFTAATSSIQTIDDEVIPTFWRAISDSRGYYVNFEKALPSKTMYYQPLSPKLTSDYIAGASDKTNLTWQLSRDTDVNFANATGNFVVIDHQAAGSTTWTTDSTITAANASTAVGTHTLTVGGLNGETMYTFRITVLTKYGNLVTTINAQTLKVSMDFLWGGTGIALGQVAQRDGLDVYMKTFLNDDTTLNGNLFGNNNVMSVKRNLSSNDYKLYTKPGIYNNFFNVDLGQYSSSPYTRDRRLPLYINGGLLVNYGTVLEVIETFNGLVQRLTMINPDAVYIRSCFSLGTSNEKWSDWQMVGGTMTAKPAYADGFSDYSDDQAVKIMRSGNVVTIIGAIRNSSTIGADPDVVMATIPDGMRPVQDFNTIQQGSQQNIFLQRIDSSGNMHIQRYRIGGSYNNVGANSWINVSCTYICAP